MTNDENQEDEYRNRKYLFHLEIKNNIGISTKFFGTQAEFDIKYKRHFDFDTYGKIIDVHKVEWVNKIDDTIVNDIFSPFYGMSKLELEPLKKKDTNRRYWKYL